jgi:hypothetical protein
MSDGVSNGGHQNVNVAIKAGKKKKQVVYREFINLVNRSLVGCVHELPEGRQLPS